MLNALSHAPLPFNEPVLSHAPGTPERAALKAELARLAGTETEMPLIIGGKEIRTGKLGAAVMPHAHAHVLGRFHLAGPAEVGAAIDAAVAAQPDWARMSQGSRAAIFLKAAELLATKYRPVLNAATMLGQSKTAHQAEIDAACELIDFFRFNVHFAERILAEQPISAPGMWNQARVAASRGLRVRSLALQLHLHRGQPAHGAGHLGQHRAVEAGVDRGLLRALHHAAA